MKKVIAAINMTLDGIWDNRFGFPYEEVHQHYADILRTGESALYGKIRYQLMEFCRTVLKNPTPDKAMDYFATASIPEPLAASRLIGHVTFLNMLCIYEHLY